METPKSREHEPLEFKDTKQATEWTLGRLEGDRKKSIWPRKNKYQKARAALVIGDWIPSQKIINQEYQSSADVLESARINVALLHPQEKIHRSAPIVKNATYFAILLNLIDQQIRLGNDSPSQKDHLLKEFNSADRLIVTREYGVDFSVYSAPQLLRELSILAKDIKI